MPRFIWIGTTLTALLTCGVSESAEETAKPNAASRETDAVKTALQRQTQLLEEQARQNAAVQAELRQLQQHNEAQVQQAEQEQAQARARLASSLELQQQIQAARASLLEGGDDVDVLLREISYQLGQLAEDADRSAALRQTQAAWDAEALVSAALEAVGRRGLDEADRALFAAESILRRGIAQ